MGNSVIFTAPDDSRVRSLSQSNLFFSEQSLRNDAQSNSTATSRCSERKSNVKIPYLYFNEKANIKKNKYLIIYYHGNSELLNHVHQSLEEYHRLFKVGILCAEYPGYGLHNKQPPSEKALVEDATSMIQYCTNVLNYNEQNIVLFGRGLGSGVAAKMSLLFPNLRGLVMISPYLSIRDIAVRSTNMLFARFVPDVFRTKDIIGQIKPPVLLIHGLRDQMVPCTNSSYLYDHCNGPKMLCLIPEMEHNKFDTKRDIYLPMIKFFVEKLGMIEFFADYVKENAERTPCLSSLKTSKIQEKKEMPLNKTVTSLYYDFEKSEPSYQFVEGSKSAF